jgi:hypothetical protein
MLIILNDIYGNNNSKEGFIKKAKKGVSNTVNKVSEAAEKAAAAAKAAAEAAAKAAAEKLSIQKALYKLIDPIINLKKTITNSLNFMKQF